MKDEERERLIKFEEDRRAGAGAEQARLLDVADWGKVPETVVPPEAEDPSDTRDEEFGFDYDEGQEEHSCGCCEGRQEEEGREEDLDRERTDRLLRIIADAVSGGIELGVQQGLETLSSSLSSLARDSSQGSSESSSSPSSSVRRLHDSVPSQRRAAAVLADQPTYRNGMRRFGVVRDGKDGSLRVLWVIEATGEFYLD
ncbi:hypothetical protein SEA_LILYPAD_81 [Gordonia phage LilyPad]|nr:hypothetical protein SEA_LILYPAD_81 [Gordonia phage LilyPad]